ncbi:non-hydrolyzing UDP-N-acetylglucosamine 2-epimerase [Sphingomicrobium astaxanthinifaciens]|uniref:non-hydrolyzing UDP-N-acetylglucosamine 2-epimerase n=1 Tax=Sphingomicrobium astaxanthinifaciens TaxID=1227949 RepID=UPI00223EC691|nr:UDP-N-acetylglucosamine 2-epimerase (non-hydrolyzing) [Sphingomicrobium astaxanthinifaciens]
MVFGTRPEAIKLAPVAAALHAEGLAVRLVETGQHADLPRAGVGFGALDRRSLGCVTGDDPFAYARACAATYAQTCAARPAMILVQGDTASAYGGALAAGWLGVPLAHVEAGLRSHDRANPWPEEDFRRAIDRMAALHFAPTELAAANLADEGHARSVHVTGNSGVDALKAMLATLPPPQRREDATRRLLVTCHRRENWGRPLGDLAAAIGTLAARHRAIRIDVALHPNPSIAQAWAAALGGTARVRLLEAMSHRDMLLAMRDSDLILSDSGGMQEEAPYLGTPLFILRRRTERPEGIDTGQLKLIGIEREAIVREVTRFLDNADATAAMTSAAEPYGDGRAAPRIAAIIARRLRAATSATPPRQAPPGPS